MTVEELREIEQFLAALDVDAGIFAELRCRFPKLSWSRCDASDVFEAPFRAFGRFDVHLLSNVGHCAQITSDPAAATGIVLAQRGSLA